MAAQREEGLFISSLAAAQVDEPLPRVMWALYLLLAVVATAITWSAFAQVDQISRNEGRVVPDGREQVIASLEAGILREMLVREGQQVEAGQELARLDPTRFEAQQNEGQVRYIAMRATQARLLAESSGGKLVFPPEVLAHPDLVQAETQAYQARQRLLEDALSTMDRSIALLVKEQGVSQQMAAKGLMSDVEVMRLTRQVNELRQQRGERFGRFRQEASSELVKLQSDLGMLDEQQVVRKDALTRTVLRSPVKGLVKNIRANTIGGIVTSGSAVMEIVPIGARLLIEARIPPKEVGFVHVGQEAVIKLAGYDFNNLGGLEGKVEQISPDAIVDGEKVAGGDTRYYRALISAERKGLKYKGEDLPVIPGMTANIEIKTGQRSVLQYLLQPMLKSRDALKER